VLLVFPINTNKNALKHLKKKCKRIKSWSRERQEYLSWRSWFGRLRRLALFPYPH
jgi:hypothetical protein